MTFDAPVPCSRGFPPLPSRRARGISAPSSASPVVIEGPGSIRRSCSALHRLVRLLWPLLTSAAPSRRLATPVAHPLLLRGSGAERQTSQGKTRDLHAMCLLHLRPPLPGCIGLRAFWPPRPGADASYALAVRQAGTLLAASFRFRIAPDTLAVRLAVPTPRARRGLPPPSRRPDTIPINWCLRHHAPRLAHQKTRAAHFCTAPADLWELSNRRVTVGKGLAGCVNCWVWKSIRPTKCRP